MQNKYQKGVSLLAVKSYQAKDNYFGDKATTYDEKREGKNLWEQEKKVIENYIKNIKKGKNLLDLPIGTGRFIDLYEKAELTVYGIDISEDMLKEARKKVAKNQKVSLLQGDAENIPLADNSVDYIVCVRFMNWVPISVFENVVKEFSRVTRNECIVSIPLKDGIFLKAFESVVNPRKATNKVKTLLILLSNKIIKVKSKPGKEVSKSSSKNKNKVLQIFNKNGFIVNKEIKIPNSSWVFFILKKEE